jgi:serine/threonine protein kinase
VYRFDEKTKVLGSGSFGTVFVTNSLKDPNFKVAIKVIEKAKMGDDLDLVMSEIDVLNKLDHPNIVNHMETYDDKKFVYIGKCCVLRGQSANVCYSYGICRRQRVVSGADRRKVLNVHRKESLRLLQTDTSSDQPLARKRHHTQRYQTREYHADKRG